ncbi:hypothetical protein HerbRD11066_65670 [Herbidospora sp. RD11066]
MRPQCGVAELPKNVNLTTDAQRSGQMNPLVRPQSGVAELPKNENLTTDVLMETIASGAAR